MLWVHRWREVKGRMRDMMMAIERADLNGEWICIVLLEEGGCWCVFRGPAELTSGRAERKFC
jgi:hypothetical protein